VPGTGIAEQIADVARRVFSDDHARQVDECFAITRVDHFRQTLNVQRESSGDAVGC